MKRTRTAPWNRSAPRRSRHTKLSATSKRNAKTKAQKAGRRYPNLVDNMRAATKERRK